MSLSNFICNFAMPFRISFEQKSKNMNHTEDNISQKVASAVSQIHAAILHRQERAVKTGKQKQLALCYGIGRFISANTRNKNWGKGVIEDISNQQKLKSSRLRRGRQCTNLKNETFYEA